MAISLMEALKIIGSLKVSPKVRTICLEEALGLVSAQKITATHSLPRYDNSAMDGYAVRLADAGREVAVKERVLAGSGTKAEVKEGEAIKVMTGARLPAGCEAVVPLEDVEYRGEAVVLPQKIAERANMRFAGEDVDEGERVLEPGEPLDAFRLSLLASQGISYLQVYRAPRVVVFATGSELAMHYESLGSHQIYNSNTPSLLLRAKELGCDAAFLHAASDSFEAIREAIAHSLDADLIITSGGVSVGEADYTKEAFKEMGMEIFFSKVDIRPGKPVTLGRIGSSYILALPGNPLAAQLTFELFGRVLIGRLRGLKAPYPRPVKAKLKEKLTLKKGRDTLIPGFFDGEYFHPAPKRAPGMVSVMAKSNGYIIASKDATELKKEVRFIGIWEFWADEPEGLISS
jgi:molybdopterin molybdotransferase